MARVFVGLKARLLLNALKAAGWRAVGAVISLLVALGIALVTFVAVAIGRGTDGDAVLAVLTMAIIVTGWLTLPILGFGSDSSLDPSFLTTLPLPRPVLMRGLVAASLVGPGALITAAGAAGAIVAFADGVLPTVALVVAAALQVAVCVTLSRAVVTSLSGALRSRRGRDLRVLAVFFVALAPQSLRFLIPADGQLSDYRQAADVLSWIPVLWPVRAMVGIGGGDVLAPALLMAATVPVVLALVWWWAAGIEKITTTAEAAATPVDRRRSNGRHEPLFGALLARLPRTRTGAVAAKEMRLSWRDPRRRMAVISSLLLPFIMLIGFISRGGLEDPAVVYTAVIVVGVGASRAFNQLGLDGSAWSMNEAAGADLRADLDGKALATALVQIPLVLVVAVVLAVPSGGWSAVVPAVVFSVALAGVLLGLGNITSVVVPFPQAGSSTSLWGTSDPGAGCLAGLVSLVAMAVMAVIAAPFAVVALLVGSDAARAGIAVLALPFGALAYWGFTRVGVARGRTRGPEILAALSVRPTAR